MKMTFLMLFLLNVLNGFSQEPDRVKIMHPEIILKAYLKTFNDKEIKKAKMSTYILQVRIMGNGKVCESKIMNLDSSSLVYKNRAKMLKIIEDGLSVEFYSNSFREWIKKQNKKYCISMLIKNASIFDYENEPYECN